MHFLARGIAANAYILSVPGLVRKHARFFLLSSAAALLLRLFFVFRFPAVVDDSHLYADIATNWLQHGIYGITNSGQIVPTLSRLPGYPAFLAAIFGIFGINNFRAVLLIQVLFDLGTCFLVADIARRMFSERAAKAAFFLTALCPFLANYAAAALTETLEIFFTALALDLLMYALSDFHSHSDIRVDLFLRRRWGVWLASGLSLGACIVLRPDGGILLGAVCVYLFLLFVRGMRRTQDGGSLPTESYRVARTSFSPIFVSAIILICGVLAPLIPWTLRNLHTFHRFQPLAPRYANDSDESVTAGFNRWTKTWIADYTSVQEIYWKVPGDALDVNLLPSRAFDSPEQRKETEDLFAEYNQDHDIAPELDARFATLAADRIRSAPLRYYVWLPALRIADMWLRPRTELLPSDPRWWEFDDEPIWLTISIVFGILNLLYVAAALAGLVRSRCTFGIGLFFLFLLLRSLFLGTLENPEPRYTLECYPMVIIAAAALFMHKTHTTDRKAA
jgi:hypothetical protein